MSPMNNPSLRSQVGHSDLSTVTQLWESFTFIPDNVLRAGSLQLARLLTLPNDLWTMLVSPCLHLESEKDRLRHHQQRPELPRRRKSLLSLLISRVFPDTPLQTSRVAGENPSLRSDAAGRETRKTFEGYHPGSYAGERTCPTATICARTRGHHFLVISIFRAVFSPTFIQSSSTLVMPRAAIAFIASVMSDTELLGL